MDGGTGNDTITAGSGSDTLTGGDGNDRIFGGGGNDTIDGGVGDDVIYGDGFDFVVGVGVGTGSDTINAGAGNDTVYSYSGFTSLIGGAGFDTVLLHGAVDVTLNLTTTGIESIVSGGGNDNLDGSGQTQGFGLLRGEGGNDTIRGSAFGDVIYGDGFDFVVGIGVGNGNDTIYGNAGDDTIDAAAGTNIVDGGAGNDTITAGNGSDTLIGGAGNDTIVGGDGNDTITGGDGDDYMDAGLGTDTASYSTALAAVTVNLSLVGAQNTVGAGVDTLLNVENLIGSNFNDTLIGNSGNNVLTGGGGNDSLNGGVGTDTASYSNATAGITVNLSLTTAQNTGGAGIDTLSNLENLTGSNFNDTLIGNVGNNVLNGAGGIDTVSYINATAGVTVNLSLTTAQNTGGAGTDTLLNVENLTGSNFNDTLTGNSGNNILNGGIGNDSLNGGAGVDTASYSSASAGVSVNLSVAVAQNTVGAGTDTLLNMENLTGSNFNDTLTGNSGNNVLIGGGGNDTLNAGAGTDTASYSNATAGVTVSLSLTTAQNTVGAGIDTLLNLENLTGSNFNDILIGNAGNNVLNGGSGLDTVSYANSTLAVSVNLGLMAAQNTVGAGTDTLLNFENLTGSNFNDTLTGNAATNILKGGAGADTFVLNTKATADTIADFASGADKFSVSQAGIKVGDGDLLVEGGTVVAGPGGFAKTAELVIVSGNIVGAITTSSAAAAIGSASSAYAVGATTLFAVDNGTQTGLFLFTSNGADALVSASELTLIGTASSTPATALADYLFVA